MKKIILSLATSLIMCIASAQVSKTIDVATAGSFRSAFIAAGGNKTTTTNLTVTGNIDARDVKFMRDSMPVLSVLDLTAVQINAYNGIDGTSIYTTSYAANKMPARSFIYIDSTGYEYSKTTLTTIRLPNNITSIGEGAFNGCIGLTDTIVIPGSVLSIENYAFYHCMGFTGSLKIPNTVNSIGNYTFGECYGLTGDLIIPNSVKSIGRGAFTGGHNLTGSLVLSNALTSIPEAAFQACQFTGNLVLPASVKSFGYDAFAGCDGFTGDLIFPNSVIQIGGRSFGQCPGFTACYIPNSVTTILSDAFVGCTGLKKVAVNKASPLAIDTTVFSYINKTTCELIVPLGSKAAYQAALGWNLFTHITEVIFVTLNTQGGNAAAPITTTLTNSTITAPDVPVRDGYSFVGWYKEAACTNAWDFAMDIVTAPVTLYAKWTQVPVSIVDHQFPGIRLYPNPATTTLNLGNLQQNAQISIFSMDGKLVKQQNITTSESTIDIEDFPKGVYLLKVNNMLQKFIKQ